MTRALPGPRAGERDDARRGSPTGTARPPAKGVDATTRAELDEFLDRFAGAFAKGDLAALAGCYVTPVLFVTEWDSATFDSARELAEGFRHVVAEHRDRGMVSLSHRVETVFKPAPRILEIGVRWTFHDDAGQALLQDRYRYLLRRVDDGGLRIAVVVVLGGSAVPSA
jgi:ketosteroid isomerase-like protein